MKEVRILKPWQMCAMLLSSVPISLAIVIPIAYAHAHQSRPTMVPIKWVDFGSIAQVRSYPTHVSIQTTRGCFEAPVIYGAFPSWKQTFISPDGRKLRVDDRVYETPTPSQVPKPGDNKVFNRDDWQD